MRWLFAPILALGCVFWFAPPAAAGQHPLTADVWYIPNPNAGNSDYAALWADGAPWAEAARKIDVLGIEHSWILRASDAEILAVTNFAKRHGMKLDFDVEAIIRVASEACGHMEGYIWEGAFPQALATLKRLKIHLDYMSLDSALWAGHYAPDAASCKLSVPDLVARVVPTLAPVLVQYPDIQINQIEPVPGMTNFPDWRATLTEFQERVAQGLGRRISGLFLDTIWDYPSWRQPFRDLREFTRQRNMKLGWYLNAGSNVRSDAEWLNSAASNFEYVEGTMGIVPDIALFATWNTYPQYNLPETSPNAMTSLINRYFRELPLIEAHFVGRGVHGRLTTRAGKPIAGATIAGYTPGVDFTRPLPEKVVEGTVPPNAAFALIGYRLNIECNCHGANDVLFGPIHYRETQGGSANYSRILPNFDQNVDGVIVTNETVGGQIVNRIITTAAQSFGINSDGIAVTPGAHYIYTIPAATMGSGAWYGHALILWFDANGNGVAGGFNVIPEEGRRLVSSAVTGADGRFVLPALPRVGPGRAPVSVEFSGDTTYRPVTVAPPH